MLGRRQIREKVLQGIYAYNISKSPVDFVEKRMFQSMYEIYDLYVYELNLLLAIRDYAANVLEKRKLKRYATDDEKNPNTKFVSNVVFKMIEDNPLRKEYTEKHSELLWNHNDNYPAIIFKKFQTSLSYLSYLQNPNASFEEDSKLIQKLFMKYIAEDTTLYEWVEELKLQWADDFHIANNMTLKTLKSLWIDKPFNTLIQVFKNDEDRDFARDLFEITVTRYPEFLKIIQGRSRNWELDRIAELDKIILSMGFCEFNYFPQIPTKVVINECIELAKAYSTPNSHVFINGILDKYAKDMGRI